MEPMEEEEEKVLTILPERGSAPGPAGAALPPKGNHSPGLSYSMFTAWDGFPSPEKTWEMGERMSTETRAEVGAAQEMEAEEQAEAQQEAASRGRKRLRREERLEKFANGKDWYCWTCHKEKINISCVQCPRSYHYKCVSPSAFKSINGQQNGPKAGVGLGAENWVCIECKAIAKAEEDKKRSVTLSRMSDDEFAELLDHALDKIKKTADPTFHQPVLERLFPDYSDSILHPMDFLTMEEKVRKRAYKSTEAFLSDIKWILHNCYIYNTYNHPLTTNAKQFYMKVARSEMAEIEICPDCFKNVYAAPASWFIELCTKPHVLVWAKLQGHPPWPAKVVRVDKKKKEADVRFFGEHDRAWVPFDACFLLSERYCWSKPRGRKLDTANAELNAHVRKIESHYGIKFPYASPKTLFNPKKLFLRDEEQQSSEEEVEEKKDNEEEEKPEKQETDKKKEEKVVPKSRPVKEEDEHREHNGSTVSASLLASNENTSEPRTEPASVGEETESELKEKREREEERKARDVAAEKGVFTFSDDHVMDEFKGDLIKNEVKAAPCLKALPGKELEEIKSAPEAQPMATVTPKTEPQSDLASNSKEAKKEVKEVRRPKMKIGTGYKKGGKMPAKPPSTLKGKTKIGPSLLSTSSATGAATAGSGATGEEAKLLREKTTDLKKQVDLEKTLHKEKVRELKHNADVSLVQIKASWSQEKEQFLSGLRQKLEDKHKKEIEEVKRKQWCASCLKEAIYFCCWNTSYCSYNCQSKHWATHMNVCQQQRQNQHQNQGQNQRQTNSNGSHVRK